MTHKSLFKFPSPYLTKKKKHHVSIILLQTKDFKKFLAKQPDDFQKQAATDGFEGTPKESLFLRDKTGTLKKIFFVTHTPMEYYDSAILADRIQQNFSNDFLKNTSFALEIKNKNDLFKTSVGWGWTAYNFDRYKKSSKIAPLLLWSADVDKKRVQAFVESFCLIRNLINTPANDMGPEELEKTARNLTEQYDAKISVIKSLPRLEKDFPLIYAVGKSSPRAPRLIDITWGNVKHPKLTLVGKGVCFDSGGLDLKPSGAMLNMKKDMGGAAHVLGLALMIMKLKIPVRLRVLIPAVENAVSGIAMRPKDIIKSRKGLTVEIGNTDAEGRLVLADALAYACEESPDLLINFATLTGSKMPALGHDIGATLSNREELAKQIVDLSYQEEDPLCDFPLWHAYRRKLDSDTADISSTGQGPGDVIFAALFLHAFLIGDPDWIHLDIFAWEESGKPGRPKGAADQGLRAIFSYLEQRYIKNQGSVSVYS